MPRPTPLLARATTPATESDGWMDGRTDGTVSIKRPNSTLLTEAIRPKRQAPTAHTQACLPLLASPTRDSHVRRFPGSPLHVHKRVHPFVFTQMPARRPALPLRPAGYSMPCVKGGGLGNNEILLCSSRVAQRSECRPGQSILSCGERRQQSFAPWLGEAEAVPRNPTRATWSRIGMLHTQGTIRHAGWHPPEAVGGASTQPGWRVSCSRQGDDDADERQQRQHMCAARPQPAPPMWQAFRPLAASFLLVKVDRFTELLFQTTGGR